ncbi:MAG: hypothetical protein J0I13_11115 [Rhizobiales bacterium]|nr:hypothetical protein [Hyphomicrobiales bacterium]
MNLKRALTNLVHAVVEEAERNPEFSKRVEEALGLGESPRRTSIPKQPRDTPPRAAHRRAPAVLDPVDLARQGETALRARLGELTLEQLKDIVADYGMDPGKLVLKWKTPDRIIGRIVEVSIGRAKKGEGFLSSGSGSSEP